MTESCPPAPLQGLNTPNYPWPASSFHDPFLFPVSETLFLHLSNSYPVLGTSSNARPLRRALLATPVLPDSPPRPLFPGRPRPPAPSSVHTSLCKFRPWKVHSSLNQSSLIKTKMFSLHHLPHGSKAPFLFLSIAKLLGRTLLASSSPVLS